MCVCSEATVDNEKGRYLERFDLSLGNLLNKVVVVESVRLTKGTKPATVVANNKKRLRTILINMVLELGIDRNVGGAWRFEV